MGACTSPRHQAEARENDLKGYKEAKKKMKKSKGQYVLVTEHPRTYIFVKEGENIETKVNNHKNNLQKYG